jgi:hypothetical protein
MTLAFPHNVFEKRDQRAKIPSVKKLLAARRLVTREYRSYVRRGAATPPLLPRKFLRRYVRTTEIR